MKKRTPSSIIVYLFLLIPVITITFTACKKKESAPVTPTPTPTPTNTLDKTTIQNILWYNQGGSIKHEFKSNGVYRFTGTWKWINNSDTMEIEASAGDPKLKWKFYYNTEHEMKCRWINNSQDILFKDAAW